VMLAMVPSPASHSGAADISDREKRLAVPGSTDLAASLSAAHSVWLIESSELREVYSNGLQIDLTFTTSNRPRERYAIFPLSGERAVVKTDTQPAGVVFHTTESLLAPFEEDQNRQLKQLGRNLLEFVREQRAYHFIIDRFGRVFRVVAESEAANHAGKSVWADSRGIYVNLNTSFLGIAFETQTSAAETVATPAQIAAGKMLIEMLRWRYHISPEDCVTHAQVSVNPLTMRIGTHTDWAGSFPFASFGLPNNYSIALPSLYAFGFDYDGAFLNATGGGWQGLHLAEDQVRRKAAAEAIPVPRYRSILQHRYRDITTALNTTLQNDRNEGGIETRER
jgi:N-acetylmuramoyl-L-alanine amidase-like protein